MHLFVLRGFFSPQPLQEGPYNSQITVIGSQLCVPNYTWTFQHHARYLFGYMYKWPWAEILTLGVQCCKQSFTMELLIAGSEVSYSLKSYYPLTTINYNATLHNPLHNPLGSEVDLGTSSTKAWSHCLSSSEAPRLQP